MRNVIVAGAVALSAAASASAGVNLLTNGDFNTPGQGSLFDGWMAFGEVRVETAMPIEGVASAKIFGNGIAPQNDSVLLQNVDITGMAGNLFDASITLEQRSDDPLAGDNLAVWILEFEDSSTMPPVLLQQTVGLVADATMPPLDTPTVVNLSAPAPLGATTARVVLVFVQLNGPDPSGALFCDLADLVDLGAFDFSQAWNLDFEDGLVGEAPAGWEVFGNASQNGDGAVVISGTRSLIQFGNFPDGGALNDTLAKSQPVTAAEGDELEVSASVAHYTGDPLVADNIAFLNIEWYDAADGLIGADGVTALTASDPTDVVTPASVTAIAPANTAYGRIVLGFQQANNEPGAAFWDDVSYVLTPAPTVCEGDADGNNAIDVNDITYVVQRLGNMGSDGDVDGNNQVDVNDITFVVQRLGNPCP